MSVHGVRNGAKIGEDCANVKHSLENICNVFNTFDYGVVSLQLDIRNDLENISPSSEKSSESRLRLDSVNSKFAKHVKMSSTAWNGGCDSLRISGWMKQ